MNGLRILIAALIAALLATDAPAQSLTLNVTPAPADEMLRLNVSSGPFAVRTIATSVPEEGAVTEVVTVPAGAPSSSTVLVIWRDNSETGFPVLLAPAFAGLTVDIYLHKRDTTALPSAAELRAVCTSGRPDSISSAFIMLQSCRGYALAFERAGNKWDRPHREALQGWLVANYYLFTLAQPVSPYGIDTGLAARINDILADEAVRRNGDRAWLPLRLADARDLLALEASTSVRMAGFVPQLVRENRLEDAELVNGAALEAFPDVAIGGSISGITRKLLRDNASYIETIQSQSIR